MDVMSPPSSLFGLPLAVKATEASQLRDALQQLWIRQMGKVPQALESDLDDLRRFFDPLATGGRLRRLLSELPPPPKVRSRFLVPPIVLARGDEILVTPEGRVVLAALDELLSSSTDITVINPDAVSGLVYIVYQRYQQWGIRRLDDVVRLMSGLGRQSLAAPAMGFLLLLLVNGSRSPETALRRPPNRDDQNLVYSAVSMVIKAFSDSLGKGDRDERHFSLYSGWPVSEARRRVPEALGPGSDAFYIVPGHEDRVISLLATEMRRQKRSLATEAVLAAFDALVSAYRSNLPAFTSLGMAHEQRAMTRRLRERLEVALGSHG